MESFVHPAEFHKNMIAQYGARSIDAVVWPNSGFQFHLISELVKQVELFDGCSILDAGGGRMDLYGFVKDKVKVSRYVCVDLCKELLDVGKAEFPDALYYHGDILDFGGENCDFVFSSGLLSYALVSENPYEWVWNRLEKMFDLCKVACVLNFNSYGMAHRTGARLDRWHLPCPKHMLEMALDLTDRVRLDHSHVHGFETLTLLR
ncbi:MAG: class I SAM-dependent methyltransferase [bacterium]